MQKMINSEPNQSKRKLFYGLFIFPLLIAVGMAVLLCTVVLLTREAETPESLITSIKTGSPSKRWQKAFELSNELNQGRGLIREAGLMKEVIHILNERQEYDAKTRAYMAIALSKFQEPEVVPVLRAALEAEGDSSVQIYLIWALGVKKAGEAVEQIIPYLKNPDPDLRKTASYVLGALEDPKAVEALEPLLSDADRDVRWNAALSLAKLGSDAGYSILMQMLDREALVREYALPEEKIEEIMVNATRGIALLRNSAGKSVVDMPESFIKLSQISNTDKSLKVRQAAIEALRYQKQKTT